MRIAVIGTRGIPANYGGFETCAEEVCTRWAAAGHDVHVYCRAARYEEKPESYSGCRLTYVPSVPYKSFDTLTSSLMAVLHLVFFKRDVDFVHLYNSGNALFLPLLMVARKKVLISVDGIEWKRKKWGPLGRRVHALGGWMAASLSAGVISDNSIVTRYYQERFPRARVSTIPYGARTIERGGSTPRYSMIDKYKLLPRQYYLFVGRLVPEKGVHLLLEAYRELSTELPLVIVGDGDAGSAYSESLLRQASDKIRFLGSIYGREYEELLANAYLYVSASELEGTSPSLLAAMGARVCTLVNGIEENVETVGNSGFVFRVNDVEHLRSVWQGLADRPDRVRKMAEAGFRHVQENYTWDAIASAYLDEFESLG